MRKLAVCLCLQCGRHTLTQLPSILLCPRCGCLMNPLSIPAETFLKLSKAEQDFHLVQEILHSTPISVRQTLASQDSSSHHEIIALLCHQVYLLKKENSRLEDTVSWMHQTIWTLVHRIRMASSDDSSS